MMLSGLMVVTACSPSEDVEVVEEVAVEHKVQLNVATVTLVDAEGNGLVNKEVEFEDGDTLADVMEDNFTVENEDGFLTSIEGHEQSPEDNIFLVFEINGEMVMTGMEDTELSDGDEVAWKLEQF